jgi:hypothetical protein
MTGPLMAIGILLVLAVAVSLCDPSKCTFYDAWELPRESNPEGER